MHFRNTQEMLHYYSSQAEDLRVTEKQKAEPVKEGPKEAPQEELRIERPRRGRKA